jgi:hypothetical protein
MAPMPQFMLIWCRIGPLTTVITEAELEVLPRAVMPVDASARITGKVLGPRAGHHRVDRHLFHRVFPQAAVGRGLHAAHHLVGRRLVPASIAATRASVGSTMGRWSVQPWRSNSRTQVVFGVGCLQARRGAGIGLGAGQAGRQPCVSPSMTSRITGAAGVGIVALHVGAQLGLGLAHHRLRHITPAAAAASPPMRVTDCTTLTNLSV